MAEQPGHPVSVLYGLSVLDAVNQVASAVLDDFAAQPERYGDAAKHLTSVEAQVRSDSSIVFDLEKRTAIYEAASGAPHAMLPPLSVAEFSWRDAALAFARCERGNDREVARAVYARSAESLRDYIRSVNGELEEAVATLRATFDAANRILALPGVGSVFRVKPLPIGWPLEDDLDYESASIVAALAEEFMPPPFGRLSTYEVVVLKRLSVRRRRAMQMLVDEKLDLERDAAPIVDWAQALEDFQLVSASRALRGQQTGAGDDPSRVSAQDVGFLPSKVIDLISACAAGGT